MLDLSSQTLFGIGIDLVENQRIAGLIERYDQRFLHRIFTEKERRYCLRKRRSIEGFAARFAAKEAFLKAIGTGLRMGTRWRDIGVVNNSAGKPLLEISGPTEELLRQKHIAHLELSLTHSDQYAAAIVVALKA